MPRPDKAKLLARLLEKLRGTVTPAALPACAPAQPAPGSTPAPHPDAPEPAVAQGPDIFHGDPVLKEFVRSFLIWESTTARADAALRRVASAVVDINEFRVCLPAEMAAAIGNNYPRIEERVTALRAALNQLFKRQNRLRLSHLSAMGKKPATGFLDAFGDAPPTTFAARRVALLCCQAHSLPVDGRIAALLQRAKVIEPGAPVEEAAAAVTRLLKAGDARDAYALLQAAADQAPLTPARVPKPAKPAPAKRRRQRPKTAAKKPK